jgi:hypothetical protein
MHQQPPRLLFSQVGVDGHSAYNRGNWRKIAVHGAEEVRGFFGPYEWLSNTHRSEVFYCEKLVPGSLPVLLLKSASTCTPDTISPTGDRNPRVAFQC